LAIPNHSELWIAAGALGTLAGSVFLCWYTVITHRLMRITKWASEPFVTLTMDEFSVQRKAGTLFLRNVGGSPAIDVVVLVDDRHVPLGPRVPRLYRCDLLSPHGGQTVVARHVSLEGATTGQRFIVTYRNIAGHLRSAPAALVLDPIQDSCFRWDFPRSPSWWRPWTRFSKRMKRP